MTAILVSICQTLVIDPIKRNSMLGNKDFDLFLSKNEKLLIKVCKVAFIALSAALVIGAIATGFAAAHPFLFTYGAIASIALLKILKDRFLFWVFQFKNETKTVHHDGHEWRFERNKEVWRLERDVINQNWTMESKTTTQLSFDFKSLSSFLSVTSSFRSFNPSSAGQGAPLAIASD